MAANEKVLYTGKTHTLRPGRLLPQLRRLTGGQLSSPGGPGTGTNPEQIFAAGWSGCFIGAMGSAARQMKVALPTELAVDTEVDLISTDGEYALAARLNVSLPGIPEDVAQEIVDAARRTCPYSKMSLGDISAEINLV